MIFQPDIPPHVAAVIRRLPPDLTRSIKAAIRLLSEDPEQGVPLVREMEGLWKYRVRRFRIVCALDRSNKRLRIVAVGDRRWVYEDLADELGRRA